MNGLFKEIFSNVFEVKSPEPSATKDLFYKRIKMELDRLYSESNAHSNDLNESISRWNALIDEKITELKEINKDNLPPESFNDKDYFESEFLTYNGKSDLNATLKHLREYRYVLAFGLIPLLRKFIFTFNDNIQTEINDSFTPVLTEWSGELKAKVRPRALNTQGSTHVSQELMGFVYDLTGPNSIVFRLPKVNSVCYKAIQNSQIEIVKTRESTAQRVPYNVDNIEKIRDDLIQLLETLKKDLKAYALLLNIWKRKLKLYEPFYAKLEKWIIEQQKKDIDEEHIRKVVLKKIGFIKASILMIHQFGFRVEGDTNPYQYLFFMIGIFQRYLKGHRKPTDKVEEEKDTDDAF